MAGLKPQEIFLQLGDGGGTHGDEGGGRGWFVELDTCKLTFQAPTR